MNEFLTYFLKVNVALALFYILFRVVFYRDTFWVGRRVYLISAILISMLYPFISLSGWLESREPIQVFIAEWTPMPMSELIVFIEPAVEATAAAANPLTWQQILLFIYIGVSAVFFLRFFGQLFSILLWRKRSRKAFIHNTSVRILSKDIAPFSFFNSIYINPDSHNERELKEVLAHENTHVRQWHSMDVLLGELLRIVCWANPFAWLLKNEIRQNLEFLADNGVVTSGFNAKKYQYHLTELALYSPNIQITNRLNVSSLKKRITMMNRRETKKMGLIKYALILPVTFALILWSNAEVVSSSVAAVVENMAVETSVVAQQQEGTLFNSGQIRRAGGTWSIFVEGDEEGIKFLNENARFSAAMIENSNARAFSVNMIIERDGSVGDISTWNVPNDDLNAEILRVIRSMPNWRPAIRHGETVRSTHLFWLSFGMVDGRHGFINTPPAPPAPPPPPPPPPPPRTGTQEVQQTPDELFISAEQTPQFPGGNDEKVRFFIRNINYPVIAQENGIQGRVEAEFIVRATGEITDVRVVRGIDPALDREVVRIISAMPKWIPGEQNENVRQTLSVSFRLQGDEPDVNHIPTEYADIVVVAFGRAATPPPLNELSLSTSSIGGGNFSLIIVDGEEKDIDYVHTLDISDIVSITILRDATSIARFSERGGDGVMLIITRRTNSVESLDINAITLSENTPIPLFIVDGDERDIDYVSAINSNDIKNISVLKDETAITHFGERGRNGVIIISTRRAHPAEPSEAT
jgi:TonB family protein